MRVAFYDYTPTTGGIMKKKPMEADLDPPNTPRTRPGSKIAERALAESKPAAKPSRNTGPSRPGASAAARAVEESKRKGGRGR
jgi:hypothetical protein